MHGNSAWKRHQLCSAHCRDHWPGRCAFFFFFSPFLFSFPPLPPHFYSHFHTSSQFPVGIMKEILCFFTKVCFLPLTLPLPLPFSLTFHHPPQLLQRTRRVIIPHVRVHNSIKVDSHSPPSFFFLKKFLSCITA